MKKNYFTMKLINVIIILSHYISSSCNWWRNDDWNRICFS